MSQRPCLDIFLDQWEMEFCYLGIRLRKKYRERGRSPMKPFHCNEERGSRLLQCLDAGRGVAGRATARHGSCKFIG